jgi:hypothetical protein
MAILGSTQLGDGRYRHTLDHNPSIVATIGRKGSIAHTTTADDIWLKTDDGETTNWICTRQAVNLIANGPYNQLLSGVTNVEEALGILDGLNMADVGGGIAGGCVITQHNQSQPFSEVTTTTWTTLAAMAFEGFATYPISVCYAVVSLSNVGEGAVRVQDVTNNNTITEISWTDSSQHIEIDPTLENVPTGLAVFEIQLRKITGGKPRLWSLQLK